MKKKMNKKELARKLKRYILSLDGKSCILKPYRDKNLYAEIMRILMPEVERRVFFKYRIEDYGTQQEVISCALLSVMRAVDIYDTRWAFSTLLDKAISAGYKDMLRSNSLIKVPNRVKDRALKEDRGETLELTKRQQEAHKSSKIQYVELDKPWGEESITLHNIIQQEDSKSVEYEILEKEQKSRYYQWAKQLKDPIKRELMLRGFDDIPAFAKEVGLSYDKVYKTYHDLIKKAKRDLKDEG